MNKYTIYEWLCGLRLFLIRTGLRVGIARDVCITSIRAYPIGIGGFYAHWAGMPLCTTLLALQNQGLTLHQPDTNFG